MRLAAVLLVAAACSKTPRTPGPGVDVMVWPEGRDPASPDQRRDYATTLRQELKRAQPDGDVTTAGDRDAVLVLHGKECTVRMLEIFREYREEGDPPVSPRKLGFRRIECAP